MSEQPVEVVVPDLSLVVLVGASGSGKSTFAARHFRPTQVVSSDACRGVVSDDETDQSATPAAFALLHHIAGVRLARGLLTVVDATSVKAEDRASLVRLAREHDVLPVAVVLDVGDATCLARNAARTDRVLPPAVVRRQGEQLRRGLRGLAREGFRKTAVLRGAEDVERAVVRCERQYNDRREDTGPFDVVGDVHGCLDELVALLARLGWVVERDADGRPVGAAHPAGRRAVFLGDLVDRGPDSPGVLRLVMGMVAAGTALAVPGNHEDKLVRALRGRDVQVAHGLERTLAQLQGEDGAFRAAVADFCAGLVSHYVLDGSALVVAHAGLREALQGRSSRRVRDTALYGETTGGTDELGLPVRLPWARDYRGRAAVLYGHTPVLDPQWVNGTLCLDTGCVFGGRLSALRWPERELVDVPALAVHCEPARPLAPADGAAGEAGGAGGAGGEGAGAGPVLAPASPDRAEGALDVADVLGRRVVETRLSGRVTVREDGAAAALEVISRFAVAPELLLHLPPTMSPPATSRREGLLEHPAEAFAHYREEGVDRVSVQEKHMGSRAVALVPRPGSPAAAAGRRALHTRTGRSFFDPALTREACDRLGAAAERAGLFEELGADWLLLDAEVLPWSVKAGALLRDQYAATAAAAGAALPVAAAALAAAAARGQDVGALLARTRQREADAAAFARAYRRFAWPTDGLDGVRVAPFQVLFAGAPEHGGAGAGPADPSADPGADPGAAPVHAGPGGTSCAERPHAWHLGLADRLAAADPGLLATTRRVEVDLADPDAEAFATTWWEEMTAAGGEGVVVKPAVPGRGRRGRAQPGVKVRGAEHLRLVYGPDHTAPEHLARLRERRSTGRKRSLALREHALGLEALDRLQRAEPLWRVHECVAAVLALESDPVDPRL